MTFCSYCNLLNKKIVKDDFVIISEIFRDKLFCFYRRPKNKMAVEENYTSFLDLFPGPESIFFTAPG